MLPPPPDRGPLSPGQIAGCLIVLALFLTLFGLEIASNFQPAKLSAVFVVLFWVPLLVLHECGHALMAALLGCHVGQVVIGMGQLVRTFRVGPAVVEWRLFPLEGFVKSVPTNLKSPQLKSALIYAAGPAADLLIAAAVLWALGPEILFAPSQDYAIVTLQSLALAATVQGVLNLIPHYIERPNGMIPNDGLGIIRSFLLPDSHYASLIGWRYNEREGEWEPE